MEGDFEKWYSQVAQEALEERRDSSAHLSKSERPKRERGGKKKHQQQHPDSEEADNMPTLSGLHLPSSSPTGTGGVAAPGMAQPSTAVRIAVMGAARVGKSSLIQQFLYGRVPKQHNATVEELHRRDYGSANGGRHRLTLELLDTSGSYQFPAMRQLAITTAQAFILVYAIDDQESFEEVKESDQRRLCTVRERRNLVQVSCLAQSWRSRACHLGDARERSNPT
ncbi:hypothetical protein HPB49_018208 [Dermacentor silvarum]|uniref:Uncharacterized protein n=1 Tax=Dermacentor silvarum TaxID=543639 RepID=A0ACB8CSE0_DERSI|nr:hypothetical protein HPB49_018208 [Dermacentor silvarum]